MPDAHTDRRIGRLFADVGHALFALIARPARPQIAAAEALLAEIARDGTDPAAAHRRLAEIRESLEGQIND